jgi:hypothetical protein
MEQRVMNFDIWQDDNFLLVYFLPFKQTPEEYSELPINTAKITLGKNGEYGTFENIGTQPNQIMLMNNGKWFLQISKENARNMSLGEHPVLIEIFDENKKKLIREKGTLIIHSGKKPSEQEHPIQTVSEDELEKVFEENMPKFSDKEAQNVTPLDLLNSKNYTSKEIRNERFEICKGCPRLFKPTKTCKECGCFMAMKTWLTDATCPLEKW